MSTALDLSDPQTFVAGVPHSYFHELREKSPVHWQRECKIPGAPQGPGYWALTRYEDVAFVSKNPDLFSSGLGTCVMTDLKPRDAENMRQQLINMDPPLHTQLRQVMSPHFKPRTVRTTEEHTRRIVVETLDALRAKSGCDFVESVSAPISLRALTHFLGVPDKDSRKFYKWTNKLIGSSDPGVSSAFRGRLAMLQILIYGAFLARKRRRRPTDDIFSSIVNGELEGKPIDRLKQGMNFSLLIIAGNETTRNALSGGIQTLSEHAEQFELLRRDASLLPQAIDEILRFSTPVMQFRRTATQAVEISGQAIAKGDKLVLYYGAANRDPTVFANPDEFDITRRQTETHMAFGTGTHFCAGSHMAKLEMRVTLEELLQRFPNLHLNGPVERLCSNFINGIKRMPVALG